MGVYEVMEVTGDMRRLIHRGGAVHEIRDQMRRNGGLTLREEGVLLALDGKSSLEEVIGITHTEDLRTRAHARDRGGGMKLSYKGFDRAGAAVADVIEARCCGCHRNTSAIRHLHFADWRSGK